MANVSQCIYPLVETSYEPFAIVGDLSCGLACGVDENRPLLFFTDDEVYNLKSTVFSISLCILFLILIYVSIVVIEQYETRKSFVSLPFVQQCPVFISTGYLLVGFTCMSPFVFGEDNIICNSREHSLVRNMFGNPWCTLTAFAVFVGIRLVVFYICALSVCLFVTLYFPKHKQNKSWYHTLIWCCIVMFTIPALKADAVSGDMYLGICTVSLTSRENLMMLDIVPLATLTVIFAACLALSVKKLCEQNKFLSLMDIVDRNLKSLQYRLVIYNLLQTVAVFVVVGDFFWFYFNLDEWKETAKSIVECQVGLTLAGQSSNYESCVQQYAEYPSPRVEIYWIFQLCSLISVISVIVFQCSRKVQTESALTLAKISTMIGININVLEEDTPPLRSIRLGEIVSNRSTSTVVTEREQSFDQLWMATELATKYLNSPRSTCSPRSEYSIL